MLINYEIETKLDTEILETKFNNKTINHKDHITAQLIY